MERAIGVIGGVGPYAGLDLVKKVFDNTIAKSDQEHVNLYLTSCPSIIGDRTRYLLEGGENPAEGLYSCFTKLAMIGASVVVIPCNTAHAKPIYGIVKERSSREFPQVRLLNMIEETCAHVSRLFPSGASIGLLATKGTHSVGVYREYFSRYPELSLIEPDAHGQDRVHQAIYDGDYGIKAVSPVTERAVKVLMEEGSRLIGRGAQALILGCTELPLALHEGMLPCPLVDPTSILARSALVLVDAGKLKAC
ncbi:MAG: amino acid racemase [Sphaerochaetaceae bacterium]|jgi:aspartate racemase|nr:amino acid racemase [Sphaerochaetaceae bacterium]MDX9939402.1 amino acid racemase [Sphaerochaetaceae bacterium]